MINLKYLVACFIFCHPLGPVNKICNVITIKLNHRLDVMPGECLLFIFALLLSLAAVNYEFGHQLDLKSCISEGQMTQMNANQIRFPPRDFNTINEKEHSSQITRDCIPKCLEKINILSVALGL